MVLRALGKTKNKSATGISWRLLKIIKGTVMGKAVIKDVAVGATPEEKVRVPKNTRD